MSMEFTSRGDGEKEEDVLSTQAHASSSVSASSSYSLELFWLVLR